MSRFTKVLLIAGLLIAGFVAISTSSLPSAQAGGFGYGYGHGCYTPSYYVPTYHCTPTYYHYHRPHCYGYGFGY